MDNLEPTIEQIKSVCELWDPVLEKVKSFADLAEKIADVSQISSHRKQQQGGGEHLDLSLRQDSDQRTSLNCQGTLF